MFARYYASGDYAQRYRESPHKARIDHVAAALVARRYLDVVVAQHLHEWLQLTRYFDARGILRPGGFVLYDLTSSYFEGTTCPLAAFGHNRDGKRGKLQVNYGLLTDVRGCPVAVSVFKGNTDDPPTLLPEVERVRARFGIEQFVVVGDRGMISQTQITALQALTGVDLSRPVGEKLA